MLATASPSTSIQVPELTSPVVDQAGLLKESEKAVLDEMIRKLYASGRAQMAILIVPSLQGEDINDFAVKVFEQWKLGEKGKR